MLAIVGAGAAWGSSGIETKSPESDALLCIECRKSGIHWMEPGDFDVEMVKGLDGGTVREHRGKFDLGNGCSGIHVVFADHAIWYLSDEMPIEAIRKFALLSDARLYDRDEVLKARRIWEASPGGIHR